MFIEYTHRKPNGERNRSLGTAPEEDLLFLPVLLLESCNALGYNISKGVMV